MAISFPQVNKGNFVASSASFAVSLASGVAAGSIMVAAGSFDAGATSATFANDKGDSPTTVITIQSPGGVTSFKGWCVAFLTATAGAKTVTATYTGTNPTFGDMYVWEIAGLNFPVVDRTAIAGADTITATAQTGFLSTPQQAAIAFSCSGNSSTLITGRNWTDDGQTAQTGSDGDHFVATTTAPLGIQWNEGLVAQWIGMIATFTSNPIPEWLYKV